MEWNKLSTEMLVADTVGPHVGRDPKSAHKQLVWFLLLLLWSVESEGGGAMRADEMHAFTAT
jgi:hypothetical protein